MARSPVTVPLIRQDLYEPDGLPGGRAPDRPERDPDRPPASAQPATPIGCASSARLARPTISTPIPGPTTAIRPAAATQSTRPAVGRRRHWCSSWPTATASDPRLQRRYRRLARLGLRFILTADGFYSRQIKNTGDIGNQFIRYDFSLKLCVPEEECGRSPLAPTPTVQATPSTGQTPTVAATSVDFLTETEEAAEDQTADVEDTAMAAQETEDAAFLQQSGLLWPADQRPNCGFADRSSGRSGSATPAGRRAARHCSWAWGPRGLMARSESYAQADGGLRQVHISTRAVWR